MVVGVSDFAMGGSLVQSEDREPDGVAAGQCATHPQQTKHFQRGSATVLCTTVNFGALFIAQHFCRAAAKGRFDGPEGRPGVRQFRTLESRPSGGRIDLNAPWSKC